MAEITPLPNGGTWIIAEVVAPPIDELDPLPNGGTWIIAQAKCLLPTRFQYNSIGLPAEYSTRQFAVGSNSQG